MSEVVRIAECRLCDSAHLGLVVSFTPTPIADHYVTEDQVAQDQPCYPLDVVECRACGAVQLADTVDPALIYPDTYLYTTSVSRGLTEHYERYVTDALTRIHPPAGSLVVDIGSNDGTLLSMFQAKGFPVRGVEPAKAIAATANARGIPTISDWCTRTTVQRMFQPGEAAIITANHVIANVADLHDFIEGVKALLAPDGTFVFETGYWPAIMDQNLIDTIEHEHIHYMAVGPLRQFFARHGLTLVHVERHPTKGGSLRGYVQHARTGWADPSVDQFIIHESAQALRPSVWATQLKAIEQAMRAQITASGSEVWVGYGAAVGSTLLLYQFGLAEKLTALVDANPTKQGRYSPGYHLPVYPPSMLDTLKPDKIVILAWRYADMIMAQHPECAGRWILPLPQIVAV